MKFDSVFTRSSISLSDWLNMDLAMWSSVVQLWDIDLCPKCDCISALFEPVHHDDDNAEFLCRNCVYSLEGEEIEVCDSCNRACYAQEYTRKVGEEIYCLDCEPIPSASEPEWLQQAKVWASTPGVHFTLC